MKSRDRKAIKRQVRRELASQEQQMRESIALERSEMERGIRSHIRSCETKQVAVSTIIPGNIPAHVYVDVAEKEIAMDIARELAQRIISDGLVEIEKQVTVHGIEVRATVNVYADQKKAYRDGMLFCGNVFRRW